jgi:hypothetical protein
MSNIFGALDEEVFPMPPVKCRTRAISCHLARRLLRLRP